MTLQQRVRQAQRIHGVKQCVLARLVDRSESTVSKLLDETTRLMPETRRCFEVALAFIETLSERSAPVPPCFHSFEPLEALWIEFQKTLGK